METDSRDTYIGMAQYETQAVIRAIRESPAVADYWNRVAADVFRQCKHTADPTIKLQELLEQRHIDHAPVKYGLYNELIRASLGRVNWQGIAVALLSGIPDSDT